MTRESLRLRRSDAVGGALRPTGGVDLSFDSALRSDAVTTLPPLVDTETFLRSDSRDYDTVMLYFKPSDVVLGNPYPEYGGPSAFSIVRSPAGYPTTNLDGTAVVKYDFTQPATVSNKALTSNVVTLTTATAHGFAVNDIVTVYINDAVFDGTFTITGTPLSTTFTYAKTNANVGSTSATGTAYVYGQTQPVPTDAQVVVTDTGLTPGKFYYYGLFARYSFQGDTFWLRAAITECLVPYDFEYRRKLWEFVPEYYRRLDDENRGSALEGTLRRMVNVLGYEVDIQRTWALTVGDLWDVGRINSRLLDHLGWVLGAGSEAVVGDKRYRKLLNNLVYLRKFKGTKDGIEGFMTAVTGYRSLVYVGKNLYLSNDDTEQRTTVGLWEGATTNVGLTRITSAGEAGGPGSGEFYLRLTNSTGGAATGVMRYGGTSFDLTKSIPVIAGHQYRSSIMARHSEASKVLVPLVDWYNSAGGFISTTTDSNINITTSWVSYNSGWLTAPALSAYAVPRFSSASMSNAATLNVTKAMFVDRAHYPEGIPAQYQVEPTTTYESARKVWINLYPQRTNFAINSNFALNTYGWSASDPTTYELLPSAYATYTALAGSTEADYADLLAGYDVFGTQTTLTFSTATNELAIDTAATVAPWLTQTSSDFFPVLSNAPYSARVEAKTLNTGTKLLLRVKWFTDDLSAAEIAGSAVSSSLYDLTTAYQAFSIGNCTPPVGARYGRLVIETSSLTSDHSDRIRRVLIEDAAVPGAYFDGTFTDGALGDFNFTGTEWQTFSVYHMNFNAVLNALSSSSRVLSLAPTLIPTDRDVGINSVLNGLL